MDCMVGDEDQNENSRAASTSLYFALVVPVVGLDCLTLTATDLFELMLLLI